MNTFTETLDYIEHVSNYITDEVTENPGCCGVCLAENITEQQVTQITNELNLELEKFILKKPEQWIWSHNRWK